MARQNSSTSVSQPTISGMLPQQVFLSIDTHFETNSYRNNSYRNNTPRSTYSTIDSEDIEVLFLDHALWALLQIVHHVEAPIYDVRRERKLRHSSFSAAWTWSSNGIVIQELRSDQT
ncbi:hypothetical protein BYT27DRAFT_7257554 [Phlegmacium glaucopus]|nr:hypothetical protein BYT27DRAFT_7257554 [Phlegmacium glaucopus]